LKHFLSYKKIFRSSRDALPLTMCSFPSRKYFCRSIPGLIRMKEVDKKSQYIQIYQQEIYFVFLTLHLLYFLLSLLLAFKKSYSKSPFSQHVCKHRSESFTRNCGTAGVCLVHVFNTGNGTGRKLTAVALHSTALLRSCHLVKQYLHTYAVCIYSTGMRSLILTVTPKTREKLTFLSTNNRYQLK
jgi:hypothetical protein